MKNEITKLQNKADKLLTPGIKKLNPKCEVCNQPTEVAHHWIEKSRSLNLRYDKRNLIPLCHSCHAKIHNRFGNSVVGGLNVAEKIIQKRGKRWRNQMDKDGRKIVKKTTDFYHKAINFWANVLSR